jgi:hypothetical protein
MQLVNAHFGPPVTDSPIGDLAMLRCTGTVDECSKCFVVLSYCYTSLTEAQQIELFIIGLGDPLHTDVALQQPSSQDNTIIFARAHKQHNASCDAVQPPPTWSYE